MSHRYIGRDVERLEAREKATGQAVYTVDVNLPGMFHAAVKRSDRPHARILSVDTSRAEAMPGVQAVVTGRTLDIRFGPMIKDQPFLAVDKVRFVGEPVAAVAADTEGQALAAAAAVEVAYEDLPAVFDTKDALAPEAPLIHEDLEHYGRSPKFRIVPGTNICTDTAYERGDRVAALAEADQVFEDEYAVHPVSHCPMEPHAAVAVYDSVRDAYDFYSSTDGPHRRANELAKALDIPLSKVRFRSMYSGGGFGGKGALVAESILAVLARAVPGRPVKLVFSRGEVLAASQTRIGAYLKMTTGVKNDGTLVFRRAELIWDSGAYAAKAPEVAVRGALTVFGPYRIPYVELTSRLVYTNKEISGAYRGFGTTQVSWASEVQMDVIAEKLGLDPLELRLKNAYVDGDPYINGQKMVAVGLTETLEAAAREIGWDRPKPEKQGSLVRGRGLATMIKGTNTPTDTFCFMRVDQSGEVTIAASQVEIGAGQHTILAQVAAETLGFPMESMVVIQPDTAVTPYDFGQTSSRSAFHGGNAVRNTALKMRRKILDAAGEIMGVSPDELDIDQARIVAPGGDSLTVTDLMLKIFGPKGGNFIAEGGYSPAGSPLLEADRDKVHMSSAFWMFVTHAVEIEVDTETGRIEVIKLAAAHDVGRVLNLQTCRQQIEGAAIMGISNALLEEFKLENGRVRNDSLADYKVAGIKDTPHIVPIMVESMHPEGPFGAKGVGEPAAAATAPAIANALYDAVGIRINDLPLSSEKVLSALKGGIC